MRKYGLSIGFGLIFGVYSSYSNKISAAQADFAIRTDKVTKTIRPGILVESKTPTDIIKINYGFELRFYHAVGQEVDFLKLFHNRREIILPKKDSTTYAHTKDEPFYPMINKIKGNVFEVVIVVDNSPLEDKAVLLRIENDKLIYKKSMPVFFAKASDLKGDGSKEYAGMWDISEDFDKKGIMYRTYDPVVYYKLTYDGIKLDSVYTIKQNTMIYGKFMGYRFDGKAAVKLSKGVDQRMTKEIKRIENSAKK